MPLTIQSLDKSHPYSQYPGYETSVYGSLMNLRIPRNYWAVEKHYTFRRRVGQYASFPGLTDLEFCDKLYEIAKKDEQLAAFESKFKEAFGPYNFDSPTKLRENLMAYFRDWDSISSKWTSKDLKDLRRVFDDVYLELLSVKTPDDRPLTTLESYALIPSGKNSGLPFYTSSEWNEEMEGYHLWAAEDLMYEGNWKDLPPYVLQTRLQPKGWTETKIRPVWNPTKTELIAAGTLTRPIQSMMQRLQCYQGYNGPHTLPPVFDQWFREYSLFVSLDFSAYDATVHPYLMNLMMGVVGKIFPGNGKLLTGLYHYYTEGPILVPNLNSKRVEIWSGHHGVPSGIGATFMTSLINRAMVMLVMERLGIPKSGYAHIANGDDTALAIKEEFKSLFDLQKVSELFDHFGLIVNPDKRKQEVSEKGVANEMSKEPYLTFLGRYYFESNTTGKMPIMRMATGMFYQERYVPEKDLLQKVDPNGLCDPKELLLAADCIAIIQKMENCSNHSNHMELVAFIQEHVPYHLDTNLWVTTNMDEIARAVRSGRISRKVKMLDYKTVQYLLRLQHNIEQKSGKTYKDIWDEKSPNVPLYKFTPDTRHIKMELEMPKTPDKSPETLSEIQAILRDLVRENPNKVQPSNIKALNKAKKKLDLRLLELKDVQEKMAKETNPKAIQALRLRMDQLTAAITQISNNIADLEDDLARPVDA